MSTYWQWQLVTASDGINMSLTTLASSKWYLPVCKGHIVVPIWCSCVYLLLIDSNDSHEGYWWNNTKCAIFYFLKYHGDCLPSLPEMIEFSSLCEFAAWAQNSWAVGWKIFFPIFPVHPIRTQLHENMGCLTLRRTYLGGHTQPLTFWEEFSKMRLFLKHHASISLQTIYSSAFCSLRCC